MRLVFAFVLLVGPMAACSATDIPASAPAPEPTVRPSPTAESRTTTTATPAPTTTTSAGRPAPTAAKGAPAPASTFAARAAEICAAMNRGMAEVGQRYPAGGQLTMAQMVDSVRATLGLSETAVRDLRALPQPAGDATGLTSLYAEVDQLNSLMARMADGFGGNNAVSLLSLANQLGAKGKVVIQHYRDLGLVECAEATSSIAT